MTKRSENISQKMIYFENFEIYKRTLKIERLHYPISYLFRAAQYRCDAYFMNHHVLLESIRVCAPRRQTSYRSIEITIARKKNEENNEFM